MTPQFDEENQQGLNPVTLPATMEISPCTPNREGFTIGLLDFGGVPSSQTAEECVANTIRRVQHAERLGFSRYWLAEHHGASSAWSSPTPMLALLTAETYRIRLGAAGVLVAHYAAIAVARDYAFLAAASSGRIDLGMVSATVKATTPSQPAPADWSAQSFSARVEAIAGFYQAPGGNENTANTESSLPHSNHRPAIWVLGSSESSARLAGAISAGYGTTLFLYGPLATPSVAAYTAAFRRTEHTPSPRSVVAVAGICADTRADAQRLLTQHANSWVRPNVVGTVDDCAALFRRIVRVTRADEIVFLDLALDPDARQATCTMLASLMAAPTVAK